MFDRAKKKQRAEALRDAGFNPTPYPGAPPATPSVTESRTTSYPQGTRGAPPPKGQARTSSYPKPNEVNPRGFDSIN